MNLKFSGLDSNGLTVWEYEKGSAKDSNGNSIPDKKSQANKQYFFMTNNDGGIITLNNFISHLGRLGVSVHDNRLPVPRSGSATIIDCPNGECEIKEEGDSGDN